MARIPLALFGAGLLTVASIGGAFAHGTLQTEEAPAARLTDFPVGTIVYFPVMQECAGGAVERWIEIPAPGKSDDYETPAPGLTISAGAGGM
jgi:uncharacterized protein YcnI